MLVMRMNYNRDAKRVAYFENTARALAGAVKEPKTSVGQPVKRRRKVRVPMVEGNEGAGTLELVVEDGHVYLVRIDPFILQRYFPAPCCLSIPADTPLAVLSQATSSMR